MVALLLKPDHNQLRSHEGRINRVILIDALASQLLYGLSWSNNGNWGERAIFRLLMSIFVLSGYKKVWREEEQEVNQAVQRQERYQCCKHLFLLADSSQ